MSCSSNPKPPRLSSIRTSESKQGFHWETNRARSFCSCQKCWSFGGCVISSIPALVHENSRNALYLPLPHNRAATNHLSPPPCLPSVQVVPLLSASVLSPTVGTEAWKSKGGSASSGVSVTVNMGAYQLHSRQFSCQDICGRLTEYL
jgi:hypothetical protein